MTRTLFLLIFMIAASLSSFGQVADQNQQTENGFEQQENNNLSNSSSKEDLIHPNPSEGVFYLKTIKEGDDISVFDGTGRMVFNTIGEEPKMKIDVTHLEKGIYSVIVRDQDKKLKINQKIMIK
ncbi:MAG TPA: T9SS type A sorting domain-containing protein [Cryomorphaceae bacterium]|nr:T9SS type A sorting domain-containing protein [Cryomorphaceae bacterium]